MTNYRVNTTDELYHHGILGQRWGVRRYQNKDGSRIKGQKKDSINAHKKAARAAVVTADTLVLSGIAYASARMAKGDEQVRTVSLGVIVLGHLAARGIIELASIEKNIIDKNRNKS